jgi:serine/threonine-protein kinase
LSGSQTPPADEASSTPGRNPKNDQIFVSMRGKELSSKIPLYLPAGEILVDRYRIVQRLDEGGFGEVYEVDDIGFGQNRRRALKVVVAGKDTAKQAVEQIVHEFDLRSRITEIGHIINSESPQTCEYKELSLVLLPMDLADGGNLHQWLLRNQKEEERQEKGIELFRQACLGVQAIHNAGLVHLDIKPENILLVEGKAKISDFGIGRYYSELFEKNPEQLLRGGLGTPGYMSPEQFEVARERDIGPTSDIYSLGIVLFEILDGNKPFDGARTEIREKHLRMWPIRLRGDLKPLWRIVKRCMEKDAIDRYPNIGLLLNDLDRVAEGLALSIDVSCPHCGHINSQKSKPECEKCGKDLPKDFFRVCPGCEKEWRRDVRICEVCGKNIAAYNQQKARKAQIEDLKAKDPVVAITLLEELLQAIRETGDEIGYQEEAINLLKELREKKIRIDPLVKKARKAEEDHFPKQAIEIWQEVHKIVPLHQEATEKIQTLESLIEGFREGWKKAIDLMDHAKFHEAQNLLRKWHEEIPTRDDISSLLATCRERASKYNFAFDDAATAVRDKFIQQADQYISEVLSYAPNSEEALSVKKKIQEILQETKLLVQQIQEQIACADFSGADKTIEKIEEKQTDNNDVSKLKKTQAKYKEHMRQARDGKTNKDSEKAQEEADLALMICPASEEAKYFLQDIIKEKAQDLQKEAKFEEAEALLKQAKKLWPTINGFEDVISVLTRGRTEYKRYMRHARWAKAWRRFSKASKAVEQAEKICPCSQDIIKLKKYIGVFRK